MKKWILILVLLAVPALAGAQTCTQADLTHPLSVDLKWLDNSSDETGFVLERKLNAGAFTVVAAGIGANITALTDATVVRSSVPNTYTYRLSAVRTGSQNSQYSNEACITFMPILPPPPPPLQPPSGLTVSSIKRDSMQVSWKDNSTAEKGFVVLRINNSTLEKIAVGAPNATSIVDTGLQPYTTYRYQVAAFDDAIFSAPSTQVSARTLR